MADPIKENSDVVMKTTDNNDNDNDNDNDDDDNYSNSNGEVDVEAFLKKCNAKNENKNKSKNKSNNILNTPGKGWSNGDIRPEMFPLTRNGKLQLYSGTRRWIGLNKGWSRVGGDDEGGGKVSNQYSHRTTTSSKMGSLLSTSASTISTTSTTMMFNEEALAVRSLIAQLCEQYYKFGWATGTGGGVSIRVGGPSENRPWRVFVAPSGIQKEDMIGDDVFELDMDRNVVHAPKTNGLKQSACTPLWYCVYKHRPLAMSVIHTHSMNAQLATMLDPTEEATTLKLTHLEMLKGVGGHAFDDILEIPIIDNRPSEDLLAAQLEIALEKYPNVNCVLVRRHGLYVWGDSWEQAKTQAESFDYLFESAIAMKKLGIDPSAIPPRGTYRTDYNEYHNASNNRKKKGVESTTIVEKSNKKKREDPTCEAGQPKAKRSKTDDQSSSSGWNGACDIDNAEDMKSNNTPILPRDGYKHLLLDIEGCTTAISFVKDVLFPYVVENVDEYIQTNMTSEEKSTLLESLQNDLNPEQLNNFYKNNVDDDDKNSPSFLIKYMVKNDLKVASLKSFQGKMWKAGYENGTLQGQVYDDFVPMLDWMSSNGVKIYIYSSGSVQAQKLLFGHSSKGDLTKYFTNHFDISTSGNKKQKESYIKICQELSIAPSELVFCSDSEAELIAANEAGVGKVVMTIRAGNAPLSSSSKQTHPQIFSLLQLCGGGN